jgi:uncharacterized protein YciI
MPQFIIQATDHTDDNALNRRMSVREAHLIRMREEKSKAVFILGGALLNDDNKMIGSVIIVCLPDEQSVRNWVAQDVYVTGKVWDKVSITPFRVAEV